MTDSGVCMTSILNPLFVHPFSGAAKDGFPKVLTEQLSIRQNSGYSTSLPCTKARDTHSTRPSAAASFLPDRTFWRPDAVLWLINGVGQVTLSPSPLTSSRSMRREVAVPRMPTCERCHKEWCPLVDISILASLRSHKSSGAGRVSNSKASHKHWKQVCKGREGPYNAALCMSKSWRGRVFENR